MKKDLDLSRVNSIKRNQVLKCVEAIAKYDFVKRLIIFGSSTTDKCTNDSDIDICVDIIGETKGLHTYQMNVDLSNACDHKCDILTYNKMQDRMKEEIDNKGVVVYESSRYVTTNNE